MALVVRALVLPKWRLFCLGIPSGGLGDLGGTALFFPSIQSPARSFRRSTASERSTCTSLPDVPMKFGVDGVDGPPPQGMTSPIELTQGKGKRGSMTAQFAGSRSIDDRRRRRLAQESEAEDQPHQQGKQKKTAQQPLKETVGENEFVRSDVVAEESIIPRALWKVCLYGIVGVSFWSTLLWLNTQLTMGQGFHRVFSPESGVAFRLFSVFSLFVTAQLCFVIWWYRSRSRKDFGGRYRIWAWAGGFWSLTCFVQGLGLHAPLAEAAYNTWPIHTWKPELMYWFVPFSIGVLALHQLTSLDMRHSRASRVLWNTTFTCGCLSGLTLFFGDLVLNATSTPLILASLNSIWQFSISFTLLYHARFVVHVTNEAAPRQDLWFTKLKTKFSHRIHGFTALLGKIFSLKRFRSEESREAAAKKKLQRREERAAAIAEKKAKREAARNDRVAAKQLAAEEKTAAKQASISEKESARQAKKQAIADAKKARQEEKQAAELKRKAERESQLKAKAEANQKTQPVQQPKSPQSTEPVEDDTDREPRTRSGKKRKRVLGNQQRIDQAEPPNSLHVAQQTPRAKPKRQLPQHEESYDDEYDEEEQEFRNMSKKQRRKARKQGRG